MTTSYELSMKLQEAGVEQTGEYYWLKFTNSSEPVCAHYSSDYAKEYDVICRALTLDEIVRELGGIQDYIHIKIVKGASKATCSILNSEQFTSEIRSSPEEAAGELLLQIKNTSNAK